MTAGQYAIILIEDTQFLQPRLIPILITPSIRQTPQ